MKAKIITVILLMMVSSVVISQNEENSLTIRPANKNFAIELDFIPFSQDGPINLNTFRSRLFLSQNLALRLGFNIDQQNLTNEVPRLFNEGDGNNLLKFDTYEMDYFVWGINAGVEYHVLKNTRVSPYIGLDVGFEKKSSSYEDEINFRQYNSPGYSYEVKKTEVENAWWDQIIYYDPYGDPFYDYVPSERAYNAWTLNIVAGTDIYILKHFYTGIELGFGLNAIKYKEAIVKEDGVVLLKYKESKDNTFGLNFNNAIRIGFWF